MAEMRKYRVETRTYNGNGYDYEGLAGVRFEAIDGEDAIMQYKDYLKDQVASFSNLTTDEIEAEFDKIDSMDCWSELAESRTIDSKTWNAIVSYMDDDIREDVHLDMAPCSNEEFLKEYLKRDPGFAEILKTEFNMEV